MCHDFEDAVSAGIVTPSMLPEVVRRRCGDRRSRQLGAFIGGVVEAVRSTGRVGMVDDLAEALAAFRSFDYEHIYLRPASTAQAATVIALLQALVEHYADRPNLLPDEDDHGDGIDAGSPEALRASVRYVSGMTDRFACRAAQAELGWGAERLPRGIDVGLG